MCDKPDLKVLGAVNKRAKNEWDEDDRQLITNDFVVVHDNLNYIVKII